MAMFISPDSIDSTASALSQSRCKRMKVPAFARMGKYLLTLACESLCLQLCRYYLAIELIDFTLYFRSYIGVFSVIFNVLADHLEDRFPLARFGSLFPLFLAAVDSMEDSFQVLVEG